MIKTDNSPPFQGQEFKDFVNQLGIHHRRITPFSPEANGEAERFMPRINKHVGSSSSANSKWKAHLPRFLCQFRATPHSSIHTSPFEALMGWKMNISLPDASNPTPATPDPTHTCIAHNDRVSKTKMEPYADNRGHTQMSSLQSGDHVLVKQRKLNKLTPPFNSKPYTVVRKQGSTVTAQCGKTLVMCNSTHFRHIKGDILADDEEEEVQLQPLLPSQRASIVVETYGAGPAKISKHCPAKLRSPRLATPRRLHLSPP